MQNIQNKIRYVVLYYGIILNSILLLIIYLSFHSKEHSSNEILRLTVDLAAFFTMFFWGTLPNVLFFKHSENVHSLAQLIIPPVLFSALQLYCIIFYFLTHDKGLIFTVLPVYMMAIWLISNFVVKTIIKIKSRYSH